jgi:hypothetical protein
VISVNPALPLLLFALRNASFKLSGSHISFPRFRLALAFELMHRRERFEPSYPYAYLVDRCAGPISTRTLNNLDLGPKRIRVTAWIGYLPYRDTFLERNHSM